MGTEIAVAIEDVSKRFRLYQRKYTSLKERVVRGGRNPYEKFWALRDINIEVPEGQTIGILGRNGSGKSTLLKCICGVLQPTSGQVVVRGQLAGMLELGAGFQPELSGRDNIFLNGSLLGLSRRDVEARFDEIVAFAELEHFIDNQVKFYSSGMYVRLGFAVAVNVDPDVLVVDEVLAVGDENFQRKCVERIKTFQEDGRTIVFVTHSADLVRAICDRGVVLGDGNMLGDGTAGEAIRIFREHLLESGATLDPSLVAAIEADIAPHVVHGPIVITGTEVSHPGTGSREYLLPGEPLTVSVSFEASEPVEDAVFSIAVYDPVNNLVFGTDTEIMETHFDAPRGTGMVEFVFESVPLLDGSYSISLGIQRRGGGLVYDWREQQCGFSVMNPGRTTGAVALPSTPTSLHFPCYPPVTDVPEIDTTGAGVATSNTPSGDALDEADTRAYLDQVRLEIADEVRRRRAAGDFPPSFERRLDELFARFTPVGTHDDRFSESLKLADRSAYFDIRVPHGSRKNPKGLAKWALWHAEAWFMNYVVNQLNYFSTSILRVLHMVDDRLSDLEVDVATLVPPYLDADEVIAASASTAPFVDLLVERLGSSGTPTGRILHAECGDGALLAALGAAGLDAYGIDPGTSAADRAVRAGLDARRDGVLGHLGAVGDGVLAGVVLSGCVDRLTLAERRRLVARAEIVLSPGGMIAVVGTDPRGWAVDVGPVAADLAGGRPLHGETWAYLLSQSGFAEVSVHQGPTSAGLERLADDTPGAAQLNTALARLDELTVHPMSFVVVATKPSKPLAR